jgi:hypothetical protein
MKNYLMLIVAVFSFRHAAAQDKGMRAQFQAGFTCNFLTKSASTYVGAHGGGSSYTISEIHPLPGFTTGFLWQSERGPVLFRTGILLSYHVNSAKMDYNSYVVGFQLINSTNIKTRFRNLYIQLPLEIGIPIGTSRSFAIWGGVKASVLAANAGIWESSSIENTIDWTSYGPIVSEVDTTLESKKPGMNKFDFAIELACSKHFKNKWLAEARIYKGFIAVNSNAASSHTERLKQLTFEVTVGMLLNKKSDFSTSN